MWPSHWQPRKNHSSLLSRSRFRVKLFFRVVRMPRDPGSAKSSGSGSRGPREETDSPGSEARGERVGTWAMDILAPAWDNTPSVRERLREHKSLLRGWDNTSKSESNAFVDKTVVNLKINAIVMKPLFHLMRDQDRTLPSLDRLMEQVKLIYERLQLKFNNHGDKVYQDAWAIRRLCQVAKKEINRPLPPKDRFTPKKETVLGKMGFQSNKQLLISHFISATGHFHLLQIRWPHTPTHPSSCKDPLLAELMRDLGADEESIGAVGTP